MIGRARKPRNSAARWKRRIEFAERSDRIATAARQQRRLSVPETILLSDLSNIRIHRSEFAGTEWKVGREAQCHSAAVERFETVHRAE